MKYSLVIFDFDGTLADSYALFARAFNELAVKHGFRTVTEDEVTVLRRRHPREIMKHVGMASWKLPLVTRDFIAMMRKEQKGVPLFPGAADLLVHLRRADVEVAIVSSNAEDNVREILGAEAAASVTYWACGMSIFGKRSHLRGVLGKSGKPASAAIYVGDQQVDLEAARDVGIDFAAVTWGYGDPEHLASLAPAHVLKSFEEMRTLTLPSPQGEGSVTPGSAP